MLWELSNRADNFSRQLADRHYSRQKVGTKQFVKPGNCIVLLAKEPNDNHGAALWVSTYSQYPKHQWPYYWECSLFRNENFKSAKSSELITQAVSCTRFLWEGKFSGEKGMITFINPQKIKPKKSPGECFLIAGFRLVGKTKSGLICLELPMIDMPAPEPPTGVTLPLF